jgi:hypothetical protein
VQPRTLAHCRLEFPDLRRREHQKAPASIFFGHVGFGVFLGHDEHAKSLTGDDEANNHEVSLSGRLSFDLRALQYFLESEFVRIGQPDPVHPVGAPLEKLGVGSPHRIGANRQLSQTPSLIFGDAGREAVGERGA